MLKVRQRLALRRIDQITYAYLAEVLCRTWERSQVAFDLSAWISDKG